MMKAMLAAASAAFFALAAPASANECVPLAVIGANMQASGIPSNQIYASEDISFVDAYLKALGLPVPDRAQPVGILIVETGNIAIVGIVENEGGYCIRWGVQVPLSVHRRAFTAANRSA